MHADLYRVMVFRNARTITKTKLMLWDVCAEQDDFICSIHWLVTNIPKDTIASGQTVLGYAQPAPPAGTGFHRYIFRLYSQGQDTIQVRCYNPLLSHHCMISGKAQGPG